MERGDPLDYLFEELEALAVFSQRDQAPTEMMRKVLIGGNVNNEYWLYFDSKLQ